MNKRLKPILIISGALILLIIIIGTILGVKFYNGIKQAVVNDEITEEWNDKDGKVYSNIVYDEKSKNKYNLYIPTGASKKDNLGVILFIHGGSWNSGTKEEMESACRSYAKAGYITATIDYSLVIEGSDDVTMDKMLDDIEDCIGNIKKRTSELGYNVNKLALSGYSAGGHLSLLYAYSREKSSPIPIYFVFEQAGPVDFHSDFWKDADSAAGLAKLASGKYINTEMLQSGQAEELINAISPLDFVNKNSVPTIIAYGGKDTLVMPIHKEKLVESLKKYGITYSVIDFPNSDHRLLDDPESAKQYKVTALEYCKKYFGY